MVMLQPKEILSRALRGFHRRSDISWSQIAFFIIWGFFPAISNDGRLDYEDWTFVVRCYEASPVLYVVLWAVVVTALSYVVNLSGWGPSASTFSVLLSSLYRTQNPKMSKQEAKALGKKLASDNRLVLAAVQRYVLLLLLVFCILQMALLCLFIENFVATLLCFTCACCDVILYGAAKKAVAHVVYSEETGEEPERDKALWV